MGFWSINPYIGCEFGCTYCYARFAHRYTVERARDQGRITKAEFADLRGPHGFEAFERRIFVKQPDDVLAALERDISRINRRHDVPRIGIGTATDPYQPAERSYRITRRILERLARERDWRIGIVTKGTLICRDIDVLRRIAERHRLAVHISLISASPAMIRGLEPRSPFPHARLRTLRRLVDAGIDAGLFVAPVVPGVTDDEPALRTLLDRARSAGAQFAHAGPLRLYPAVRGPLFPALERIRPGLSARYRRAYGGAVDAPDRYRAALELRFARIAADVGIPVRRMPDQPSAPDPQLGLWG